ncbi:MAG: efflux RND transporter periplasmic adaptor subunit [Pseudomonadales bacterium]|nr:efflux RND transporter periplasmic adaptor subunit [Pseudomonadales bacterium]
MKIYVKYGFFVLSIVALGLLLAYFAGVFHAKIPQSTEVKIIQIPGSVVTAVADMKPAIEQVAGTIQATSDTILASRIMATILRVNVRAGDSVSVDDVLIELDNEALLAVLEQRVQEAAAAKAALEEAQLYQTRTESLRAQGNVSIAALDQAVTATRRAAAFEEAAQRAVAEAKAAMNYAVIRAPMSGTVVEHFAEAGDMASPGQPLLKIFNPGQMRIEATLRESLIGYVQLGTELEAYVDAMGDKLVAVVEEIVPSSDPTSRTFVLKARLSNATGMFPGMFARLSIPVAEQENIWIPASAVQRAGQLTFVYVRGTGSDQRRFVRLGKTEADQVEVRSGLASGEAIVIPAAT